MIPKYLPTMLDLLTKNDVVIGSRYVAGGGTVNWGIGRKDPEPRRESLLAHDPGRADPRFHGRLQRLAKESSRPSISASLRSDGYSFQIELKYRAFLQGFQDRRIPDRFRGPKGRQIQDESPDRPRGLGRVWGFRLQCRKADADRRALDAVESLICAVRKRLTISWVCAYFWSACVSASCLRVAPAVQRFAAGAHHRQDRHSRRQENQHAHARGVRRRRVQSHQEVPRDLGQVKGDKEDEGDLKTPEGIYTFKARLHSSALPGQVRRRWRFR